MTVTNRKNTSTWNLHSKPAVIAIGRSTKRPNPRVSLLITPRNCVGSLIVIKYLSHSNQLNKGGGLCHNLAGAYSSILPKIPKRFGTNISSRCDVTNSSQINSQGPSDHQSALRCVLDKTWNVATQNSKSSWLVLNLTYFWLSTWMNDNLHKRTSIYCQNFSSIHFHTKRLYVW